MIKGSGADGIQATRGIRVYDLGYRVYGLNLKAKTPQS